MNFRRLMKRSKYLESPKEDEGSLARLPSDIAKDILSRLPIKSIIQFRFVCQSWETLSQDPQVFHMHISRNPQTKFLFFLCGEYSGPKELRFIEFSDIDDDGLLASKIEKHFAIESMPEEFGIMASCNGLVCLEYFGDEYDDVIRIYNPFTREYKVVAKLVSKFSPCSYGLGCHPITREYKLVCICYYVPTIDDDSPVNVHVYNLKRNEWKSVGGFPVEQDHVNSYQGELLLHGRLHWLSGVPRHESNIPCYGLVYFDLVDDSLGKVLMPADVILKNVTASQLNNLLF